MKLTMTAYERDALTPEMRKALDPLLVETDVSQRTAPTSYTFRLDGLEFEHLCKVVGERR